MITFSNWTIRNSGDVLARQYDHLSRTLLVSGVPDGYSWRMLVRAGGSGEYFDIIALFPMENGVGAVLTRDQLSVSGDYEMQLQGTLKADGETVCHSNTILVNIPPSMTGDAKWPAVPSEFTQIERRVQAQAELAEESSNTAVSAMNTAVKASNSAVSAKEAAVKAQLNATTAESMAKTYAESAGEASAAAFNSETVASQAAETATNESSLASDAASNADDAAARAQDSASEAAASEANAKASAEAAAASAAQAAESAGNDGKTFVATYGVTTTNEIYDAYQAGKAVFCNYNGMLASLYTIERTDEAVFLYHTDAGMYSISAYPSGWSYEYRPAVDTTLTASGKAADAAAVGARLSSLSEEIVTTSESKVAAHNIGTDTHSDIRLLVQGLTDRLNALADSDDTTLDQLSEVVAYIKSNKSLIDAITTSKVNVADIVDNLTTNVANKPLSAAQGVALKALIDAISIPDKLPNPNALTFTGAVTGSYDGSEAKTIEIPSGGGGGVSYRSWSKVWTLAVAEDIAGFEASNIDLDGKSEIMIVFISDSTASRTMVNGRLLINGVDVGKVLFNSLPLKKDSHSFIIIGRADDGIEYTTMAAKAEYQTYPWQGDVNVVHRMVRGTNTVISWIADSTIEITQGSATLGQGVTIEIYVR